MVPREISEPFYHSAAWRRCRAAYIKSVGGLCERCMIKGIIKPGYIVHHKHYITADNINDPGVTLNWDNLEYLCFDCHQAEHFERTAVTRQDVMFDASGQLVAAPTAPYQIQNAAAQRNGMKHSRNTQVIFPHEGGSPIFEEVGP